jgi:hypothetical protein
MLSFLFCSFLFCSVLFCLSHRGNFRGGRALVLALLSLLLLAAVRNLPLLILIILPRVHSLLLL